MIDLRSDTLTKPTKEMRQAMFEAVVGDDGRIRQDGKGEDPTVNALEDLASVVTGKEDAMFCNSGTIGNIIALMTHCNRGDSVLIGKNNHIHTNEQSPFMENLFGLKPVFYKTNEFGIPMKKDLISIFSKNEINMLCLENSNNFSGGTCMSVKETDGICSLAKKQDVPVHLDGARIFNVAAYYDLPVKELLQSVDSVMFCVSKGLGAPIGSLLCGSKAFIRQARNTRKLLGGGMRQSGIVAAAGILGIKNGPQRLKVDNELASLLANKITGNNQVNLNLNTVQTNIVTVDISPSGQSAKKFETDLAKYGLKVKSISSKYVRMTTHHGIKEEDIIKAAHIFNTYCSKL